MNALASLFASLCIGLAAPAPTAPAPDEGTTREAVPKPERVELAPSPPAETPLPNDDADLLGPDTSEVLPPPAPHEAHRLGGGSGSQTSAQMTVTGIVLGSLGVAGVVTGATLLSLPDTVDPEHPIFVTSTRQPGLLTLTLSAAVTLTAALMLVAARKTGHHAGAQARLQFSPRGLRF